MIRTDGTPTIAMTDQLQRLLWSDRTGPGLYDLHNSDDSRILLAYVAAWLGPKVELSVDRFDGFSLKSVVR